jgi:hypothetical protein
MYPGGTVAEISTVIALLSLIASAIALFFTTFRPPKLSSVVGTSLQACHPSIGGFGIYLAVTFINASPRTGAIHRCAISLYRASMPDQRFFMGWHYFVKLDEKMFFNVEGAAQTLAVPGQSSVGRLVWFYWASRNEDLILDEGEYVLVFHYWVAGDSKPRNELHTFAVDADAHATLERYRADKKQGVVELLLDHNVLPANELLTAERSRSLLGS